MKRSSKFLIGLAAAALTFASLVAFVGPPHTGNQRLGYASHHGNHHGCGTKSPSEKADSVNYRK